MIGVHSFVCDSEVETLSGSSGVYVFGFGAASGVDVMTDFTVALANGMVNASDWAKVSGYADLAANHFSVVDGNLVTSSGVGDTITRENVFKADVTVTDFVTI